ncbi:V-type proton ATPase subunit F isoform X2 [Nymphaea colorata]|uniref:V-type proton ATPase subunit F isoform X2 n=1 Tax=Nymphaea colorata TaxID=210225 RepID=UPI00129E1B41|nr:V-type proton ATPase subunit F isoform X2 [Nymphaea colorata]
MANRGNIPTSNSALIAMIADEDTVTGFLLAGVGNVDLRRKTNYLIVDSKTTVKAIEDAFKEFTTKEDIAIVLISQYMNSNLMNTEEEAAACLVRGQTAEGTVLFSSNQMERGCQLGT